ncbi:hypothetical protein T265_11933 [Opisthorchis viverrini]|uniref:Peptidase C13 family protein n=1 Tax=Opisthorchis viverrini TaxID=6198 RepID=A0A074Z182_OPIVI|nr:hypothetical protein T265_11933 [Opisthorchis viverrini]KER19227.1 hypothetical protein T265_11933 [Opisthorchis viverrini]
MKLQVSRDMMRRSLLLALLFCIDHVALLEAIGVHNWSSTFNNKPPKKWVVLATGSNTWESYRQHDVTRDNFLNVLKGDKKLEANKKKVLNSGPDDYVFIYFSGHGGTSQITFLEEHLCAMELNDTLAYMHSKKKFNKLVLYVEACYSGSMFKDVLPSNMGIYVTTSTKEDEVSQAVFCYDKKIDVCLANEYSYEWLIDSELEDIKKRTLDEQYEEVKKCTLYSHVMKYGELTIGGLPVGKFQGHYDLLMHRKDVAIVPKAVDKKPYCQANLFSKSRRLVQAATEEEYEIAWKRLHRTLQLGHVVRETFRGIVVDVTTNHKPTLKDLSKRDELMCFKAVFGQILTRCFTTQQTVLMGRAKAPLDAARRGPRKVDWAATMDVPEAEFDTPAVRQKAMGRFKMARMAPGSDPTVFFAGRLPSLDHALPTPDGVPRHQLLSDQFVEAEILLSICFQVPEVAQHTSHLMELCKAGYEAETLIDSVQNFCS